MSSTRDIEIITFQILSYEMPIAVKQYFVTEQCTRSSIILQKPTGWWREVRSSHGGAGWATRSGVRWWVSWTLNVFGTREGGLARGAPC